MSRRICLPYGDAGGALACAATCAPGSLLGMLPVTINAACLNSALLLKCAGPQMLTFSLMCSVLLICSLPAGRQSACRCSSFLLLTRQVCPVFQCQLRVSLTQAAAVVDLYSLSACYTCLHLVRSGVPHLGGLTSIWSLRLRK
jgi:hypothetical protein